MRIKKTVIVIMIVLNLLLLCFGTFTVNAANSQNDKELVRFTVQERNGVEVENFLIQRGIPLEDGVLNQNEEIYIENEKTGEACLTQTRIMETYNSGFVKWILVSMAVNLMPEEIQHYVVKKGSLNLKSQLTYTDENGIVSVDNGIIRATFDYSGLFSLNYQGEELFDSRGTVSTCIKDGYDYAMTNGKIEIVDAGPVFVKIKVTADYGESPMGTEQTYVIVNQSSQISCTNAYISANGAIPQNVAYTLDKINSLHEKYCFTPGFNSVAYGENHSAMKENPIVSCDYASVYNSKSDTRVSFVSKDIERYRGVASPNSCNGFYYKDGDLVYSPIFYKTDYSWPDGLRRTTHLEMIFSKGGSKNLQGVLDTYKTTPSVIIDINEFVKTGILASDKMSSLAKTQLESIKWLKDRRTGSISAGNILFLFDQDLGTCDTSGIVRLGEVEYNIWYGAILSQDPDIYDMVNESTECWADVSIYRGAVKEARGLNRYRAKFGAAESVSSHGYYGEFSSLYMGYLMTGNDYYRDTCYQTADVNYRLAMAATPMNGHHVVSAFGWPRGIVEVYSAYKNVEFRSIFMLRAMYNSYNLFKEERFKELVDSMWAWSEDVQEPDGSWIQFINTMGEGKIGTEQATGNEGWKAYKNYLMLYTLRAHCEYYRQTKNADILPQIVKFADYLISELGDNDWMWNPSREKSEMNEDFSRGKSPYQEMMASEIFHTVYEATGEEKYFEAFCRVLSNYIACARTSGLAAMKYNLSEYVGGHIESTQITGQNTTLLHMDSAYCKTFDENRELAKKMGYQGLVAIFADGAAYTPEKISHEYNFEEIGANLYEKDMQRYLYVANNSGVVTGTWDKDINLQIAGQASFWTGVHCNFENIYEVNVEKNLKIFDSIYSREVPIRVSDIVGKVSGVVEKYDEKQVVFNVSGDSGTVKLLLQNGDFAVNADEGYTVSISGGKNKTVFVTKGGNLKPNQEGLLIELDFNRDNEFIFSDIINHWGKNDIMAMYNKNIVKGATDTLFEPENRVTKLHTIYFIMRALGVSDEDAVEKAMEYGIIDSDEGLNEYATREDIINDCVNAIRYARGNIKLDKISTYKGTLANNINDDKAAVSADTEKIAFQSSVLDSNIQLPKSGIYGSAIEWVGGNEYLTNEGFITQPAGTESDATATLTAIVTRGEARQTKEFEFTVKNSANINAESGGFSNGKFDIMPLKGSFNFEFDATPMSAACNWCIGFYNTANNMAAYTDLPLLLRFYTNERIEAINGNAYSAENSISYISGKTYTFKISGNISGGTYSAVVITPDGVEHILAKDYRYRSSATIGGVLDGGVSVGAGCRGIINRLTAAPSAMGKGKYGYVDGDEYFSVNRSDFSIDIKDDWNYYSSSPEYVDQHGHIIKTPDKMTDVVIIATQKDVKMFTDIGIANPSYIENLLTAQMIGLVKGNENNALNPKQICTRAEALSFVRRLYDLCNINVLVQ